MVKTKVIILLLCILPAVCSAQEYKWKAGKIDGSRTGCTNTTADNVREALGSIENGCYYAPSGRVYTQSSSVFKVASLVIDAQSKMSRVKKVIAFSTEEMPLHKRESKLSNWFMGIITSSVESLSGKKVDVGIGNFGGIRLGMPEGDVILDDILSMFPFKNSVVYLELKGSRLREIFETMAATRFQAVSGVDILVENGRLSYVKIGGQPLEDDRIYSVATISFLLNGGDSLFLAEGAENMQMFDCTIVQAALKYIEEHDGKIVAPDVRYVTIK